MENQSNIRKELDAIHCYVSFFIEQWGQSKKDKYKGCGEQNIDDNIYIFKRRIKDACDNLAEYVFILEERREEIENDTKNKEHTSKNERGYEKS
jgi:hypothetical protein